MRVRPSRWLLVPFLLVAIPVLSHGQSHAIGLDFSPKAVGLSFTFASKDVAAFGVLSVSADLQGLLDSSAQLPGVSLRFSRERWISWWEVAPDTRLGLYAGVGIMGGYLRDLDNIYGWTLALSGNTGTDMEFLDRRLSIGMEFSIDFGLDARPGAKGGTVRLYRAGIVRSLMPGIKLMWRF